MSSQRSTAHTAYYPKSYAGKGIEPSKEDRYFLESIDAMEFNGRAAGSELTDAIARLYALRDRLARSSNATGHGRRSPRNIVMRVVSAPKVRELDRCQELHTISNTAPGRLKCDRQDPCSNCVARNFECTYASNAKSRNRRQGQDAFEHLNARIRHLEQLVTNVVANDSSMRPPKAPQLESKYASGSNVVVDTSDESPSHLRIPAEVKAGRLMSTKDQQTIYVSGVHWASICEEVSSFLVLGSK